MTDNYCIVMKPISQVIRSKMVEKGITVKEFSEAMDGDNPSPTPSWTAQRIIKAAQILDGPVHDWLKIAKEVMISNHSEVLLQYLNTDKNPITAEELARRLNCHG